MHQIELDSIFKKIALKHGLPKYQIEMVYKNMFEMVYKTINEGGLENILLHRFCKFVIPPIKLKHRRPDLYEQVYGNSGGVEELFVFKKRSRRSSPKKIRNL